MPVLAGAGGYNTAEIVSLAKELEALDVDGILSVTPYYNKPTQEGLVPALQGDRRCRLASDRALQRAAAHRHQHRAGHDDAARGD